MNVCIYECGVAKIKAHELRGKTKGELLKQLEELKKELSQLRVAQVTGGNATKLAKMYVETLYIRFLLWI